MMIDLTVIDDFLSSINEMILV